jgi:SM-20-related protein
MGWHYHGGGPTGWPAPAPLTDGEVHALGEGRAVVRDAVLPPDVVRAARETIAARFEAGDLRAAGTGRGRTLDADVRGDHIAWIDAAGDDPLLVGLWRWLDALRVEVNEACWLGLQRFAVQVACYPGGGARYVRHLDALPGSRNRIFTAIVYLNPGWTPEDGGRLRAWCGEEAVDIDPLAGRLVMFRSDALPHEVLPAWAPRYTLTAWFRGGELVPMLEDPGA